MFRIPLFALSLLIGLAGIASAQSTIVGSVLDDATEAPISGATIQLFGIDQQDAGSTLSDSQGLFRLQVEGDIAYGIEVRRVGYQPIRVDDIRLADAGETEVEIRMGVRAVPIDPIVIRVEPLSEPVWLARYRDRAATAERAGRGRIISRDELEESAPPFAYQLLERMLWGNGCTPTVLLDGLPVDFSFTMVRADDIEGVEIYRGMSQIPQEYYQLGMCGLVMFWQRVDGPGRAPLTWRRVGVTAVVLSIIGGIAAVF